MKSKFFENVENIAKEVYVTLGGLDNENELLRQIYGAFFFGIINALAQEMKSSNVEIHAAMINEAIVILQYSPQQSAEFCQHLINCTNKEENPTVNAIIHRGIEGYYQLKEQNKEAFKRNYNEIIELVAEDM